MSLCQKYAKKLSSRYFSLAIPVKNTEFQFYTFPKKIIYKLKGVYSPAFAVLLNV